MVLKMQCCMLSQLVIHYRHRGWTTTPWQHSYPRNLHGDLLWLAWSVCPALFPCLRKIELFFGQRHGIWTMNLYMYPDDFGAIIRSRVFGWRRQRTSETLSSKDLNEVRLESNFFVDLCRRFVKLVTIVFGDRSCTSNIVIIVVLLITKKVFSSANGIRRRIFLIWSSLTILSPL